jgi:uncharacterized MAPEG superfamily protein
MGLSDRAWGRESHGEEPMTANIAMLVLSLTLLLLIQFVQGLHTTSKAGLPYSLSSRDKAVDLGLVGGRIQRAKVNLIENLALFAPLSVLAEVVKASPDTVKWGAIIFFVARLIHFATYIAGVQMIRTLAWLGGVVGCVMIGLAIVGWA